jgi:hypothetical protein
MPRMIDMIRKSQLPSNLMHAAARGALAVPAGENIEILVHLALHNPIFREQARLTLANWDEKACLAAIADPRTSGEVLGYFVSRENLRTHLIPALAENPAITEELLMDLAVSGSRSTVEALLKSERVKSSPSLLGALSSNPSLRRNELAEIETRLRPLGPGHPSPPVVEATHSAPEAVLPGPTVGEEPSEDGDEAADKALADFMAQNAEEVESLPEKPFEPVQVALDGVERATAAELEVASTEVPSEAAVAASESKEKGSASDPSATARRVKKLIQTQSEKRDSTLQKIAKLDIKGRIALAMRGSKEERSILIRDGTKLVALAVLDSPKVSDGEVEGFALQKNVPEAVLRAIPLKRKYAKNYVIGRNLVYNPRTPLDLSLGLMKNLLIHDLKNLSGNKEVSETIRKLALRMYKQKTEKKER